MENHPSEYNLITTFVDVSNPTPTKNNPPNYPTQSFPRPTPPGLLAFTLTASICCVSGRPSHLPYTYPPDTYLPSPKMSDLEFPLSSDAVESMALSSLEKYNIPPPTPKQEDEEKKEQETMGSYLNSLNVEVQGRTVIGRSGMASGGSVYFWTHR